MTLDDLEKSLNYQFNNKSLLQAALTHPSVHNQPDSDKIIDYERLEFLGDSVLSLVITEILILQFPKADEGELAQKRAYLVKSESLVTIAKQLSISQYIMMSKTEERSGGRSNDNILENVMESIIGAMYLDGGFQVCKIFISNNWAELINAVQETPIEPKTFVQEWAQDKHLPVPEYIITAKTGTDHNPFFTCKIHVNGFPNCTGQGQNKKTAEKAAALNFINNIIKNESTK
jgi:ribonuclease-3